MKTQSVQCRRVRASRLRRFVEDERGQDLVEYALLTGIITVAAVLIFPPLKDRMADAYQTWNSNAQAISTPPAPMP